MRAMLSKVSEVADRFGHDIEVGVDGGINASTAREALDAGARYLVAGSSVFAASIEGVRGAIDALRTSE